MTDIANILIATGLILAAMPFLRKWRHLSTALQWRATLRTIRDAGERRTSTRFEKALKRLKCDLIRDMNSFSLLDFKLTVLGFALQFCGVALLLMG